MIMRFPTTNNPTKVAETLQRLRRNSVCLEQPADSAALEFTPAAARVVAFALAESGKAIDTPITLRFDKDRAAVLVSFNPELLALLGYTPGFPAVVTADLWPAGGAPLSVPLRDKITPAQAKVIDDLEWLMDLHVVPVGLP